MSLAKTFLKHRFIIEQLRRRPQKLIELNATWKDSEDNVEGGDLLQRTLQRDIQVIREVYNIEIKCNRSTNEYEITEDNDLYAQNLLEGLMCLEPCRITAIFLRLFSLKSDCLPALNICRPCLGLLKKGDK